MDVKYFVEEIQKISLSMFRKGFFDIFHGSISAKIAQDKFLINKKNAIFDRITQDDLTILSSQKDYKWNEASGDCDIHVNIYKNIDEAKYVCYAMPTNIIACSITQNSIIPKDYFGFVNFGEIEIYDPKQFDDWYERADTEIYRYLIDKKQNIIVIRGYGIVAYARSMQKLARSVAILENSCKILNIIRNNTQI